MNYSRLFRHNARPKLHPLCRKLCRHISRIPSHQYTEIVVWYIENVIEVFHGLILLLFLKCTNLPSHSLSFSSLG